MKSGKEISEELLSISPVLAGLEKLNPFTVPAGYFENLSDVLLIISRNEESFPGIPSNKNVFGVPGGYFENLAENILGKIRNEAIETPSVELRNLSPLLYSVQNENVFEVPKGYFDHLPGNVLEKIAPQQARIVSLKVRSLVKYAVAAMLTGMVALGVYKYMDRSNNGTTTITPIATLEPFVEKGKNMTEDQFNKALDNLSSEDIGKYLEKHADESDVAFLESGIDENSLPNEEDYLLDEKTLDNFIKETEVSSSN